MAEDTCDTTVGPRTDYTCDEALDTCVSVSWDRTPQCGTNVNNFGGSNTNGDGCLGDYTLTYTVKDSSGHTTTALRTVTFIDREKPILEIIGDEEMVVEASPQGSYVEQGVYCHDYVGGDISPAKVITAGSFNGVATGPVDYTTVGTYVVDYNCKDASNNQAVTIHRTVRVVDTTPPEIQLRCAGCSRCDGGVYEDTTQVGFTKGNWTFTEAACTCAPEELEAGFQYVEQGACAIDSLDGVSGKYKDAETGNIVDTGDISITGSVNHLVPKIEVGSGVYKIYYNVQDKTGATAGADAVSETDTATGVLPNRNNATTAIRTITVKDTLPPVISLHMRHSSGALATAFHVSAKDQVGLHNVVNPAGSWLPDAQRTSQQSIQDGGGNPNLRGAAQGVPDHPSFNLKNFVIGNLPASIDERTQEGGDLAAVSAP